MAWGAWGRKPAEAAAMALGLDLNSSQPNPFKFGIWPWVLLAGGLIGIGLSFTREASLGNQPRRFIETLRGR